MKNDEMGEKEEKNVPFAKFSPYFKDAMEKTNFADIHIDPFLIIGDSPSLIAEFETFFNDVARHYSSLFPPQSKEEEDKCSCRSYPETNFNARLSEALLSFLKYSDKRGFGWNGFDLAKYSVALLNGIFSLNSEGESLFPCINGIKERAGLQAEESYVTFRMTYIDHDLDGNRGFSVGIMTQHFSR